MVGGRATVSNKLTVASIQMDCILNDRGVNLNRAGALIRDVMKKGAQLVMLPELFNAGYRVEEYDTVLAEPISGAATQWMHQLTAKHHIYIAGTIIESRENGIPCDAVVMVGPEGFKSKHRKMHLWSSEDRHFGKGEQLDVIQLPLRKTGLLICYEIGFPEIARIQVHKGADILVYAFAFGRARYYAWDTASHSKALGNGAFVMANNRCGQDKDGTFGGLSRIVGPDTTILASYGTEGDAVAYTQIDLDGVTRMCQVLPYLRDMSEKLYNDNF